MLMSTKGSRLLQAVKESTSNEGPTLSLQVGCPVEAILRPVATQESAVNASDIQLLTSWRNRFVRSFLTEFEATEERTRQWLVRTVGPDNSRILFMLDEALSGQSVGYMGLAFIDWTEGYGEADAIVRGKEMAPGLMTRAMRTMFLWATNQLGLHRIGVRVRSDNTALEFYQKFGFQELHRVSLRKTWRDGMVQWTEDSNCPSSQPSLVHMVLPETNE